MPKIKGLRWWMIGLIMLGSIVNYLTRSTLAVAAPTLLKDLHITEKQYSWIVARFQVAIMLQPFCGLRAGCARPEDRLRHLCPRLVAHQHGARPGAQLAGARRACAGCSDLAKARPTRPA